MKFRDRWNLTREMWDVIQHQRRVMDAQLQTIEHLKRERLELTRASLTLCHGLLTEIEDPGSIDRNLVIDAARDWADEIARQEELVA